eukprot:CAMPEP_0194068798 /NCGR_PEP_ID=MMETSP0009_2-20130614/87292_1 /TAXON_ID=210454 /ORGANISM="Grammatophora oceanica, Strain CCMP 410" /LENGTH=306 /DNA_ID=CAMNT_0038721933 /DNA_START=453 /DNA_END=1373 /DNA_ORIENTATION=-
MSEQVWKWTMKSPFLIRYRRLQSVTPHFLASTIASEKREFRAETKALQEDKDTMGFGYILERLITGRPAQYPRVRSIAYQDGSIARRNLEAFAISWWFRILPRVLDMYARKIKYDHVRASLEMDDVSLLSSFVIAVCNPLPLAFWLRQSPPKTGSLPAETKARQEDKDTMGFGYILERLYQWKTSTISKGGSIAYQDAQDGSIARQNLEASAINWWFRILPRVLDMYEGLQALEIIGVSAAGRIIVNVVLNNASRPTTLKEEALVGLGMGNRDQFPMLRKPENLWDGPILLFLPLVLQSRDLPNFF